MNTTHLNRFGRAQASICFPTAATSERFDPAAALNCGFYDLISSRNTHDGISKQSAPPPRCAQTYSG